MGIKTQITTAAILTLAIAGCTSGETPEATNTPSPANPAPTSEATAPKPPADSTFVNPVIPPPANRNAIANGGIIQSTQIQPRLLEIQKGRTDPFAQIVANPAAQMSSNSVPKAVPKLPPLPTPIQPQTNQNRTPGQTNNPAQARQQGNPNGKVAIQTRPKPISAPVLPKLQPQVITKAPIVPVLPPQPQPDSARAVLVSGVILIGKQPQAIIKVPDEPTSRYVQSGQRLANGVLIKRIEMNRGSDPVVILEQYGIEVAKSVGEKPANSDPSKTAAAGNPISMVTLL
ncbi:hypothetical protein VB713_19305 [Anabaena cylindrica UHCC 0172]|uniref:hypothetical protein n=1 Tax=Anabaena cylindrica TaxID=1165 RepID=UPI002B20F750|nr:hypothetical protein [Anabaena cylindrica]MEA5553096.1 hypothetical protein [Anabaena cylindrica UHCC 0172]